MRLLKWVLLAVGLIVLVYNVLSVTGHNYDTYTHNPYPIDQIISEGTDAGRGNIIGFQPYFTAWDYCDQQHFLNALDPYFKKARAAGLCKPNTIVVLPEYTGSWLVACNEKARVYQADSMRKALSVMVNARIFSFILKLLSAQPKDKIQYTLFSIKARSMAKIYYNVFSSLAKNYGVTIVAGSIILPGPSVNARGKLSIRPGRLYNASFVFGPDGQIVDQPVKKMLLAGNEKNFLTPAAADEPRLIQTAAGSVAVLLSNDSRSPAVYDQVKARARIMAAPAINGLERMESYLPGATADSATLKTDSAGSQSLAGLGNMAVHAGIRHGMLVSFSGKMWEIEPRGDLLTLQQDSMRIYTPVTQSGRIVNVWLN